ncbi:MAG: NAD-dependent protein deacylase [Oscillospiraceae bacterium]
MDEKISRLREMIDASHNIVFFGGAGVSTESGIPDFRSVDGLYHQKYKYPPEEILSGSFFEERPEEFYEFYRDKLKFNGAKPNPAHLYLAELERQGRLSAVVTQNIDGLHQDAGSKKVLELHGTLKRFYCTHCGREMSVEAVNACSRAPRCSCGGIVRPDVVLYEECLNSAVLSEAMTRISQCDMLIIGGTSLVVYPASGLVNYYKGDRLVLINKMSTPYDGRANLVINEPIGKVFSQL